MKVSAALDLGKRYNAEIISGSKGINRAISSVEVMEIPEVEKWATEGILVITSFYSVKDDSQQQYQIVKTLIEKNAAGLIVKLGRFVNVLPRDIIQIAEKSNFPIITIPKDVAYIDLLSPLYRQLNEEANKTEESGQDIFDNFKKGVFDSTGEAIECLSEIVNHPIYIEDDLGRLLYSSNKFTRDEWRDSSLLFAIPCSNNYEKKIQEWRDKLQTTSNNCIHVPGQRNRFIIPLITKGKIIAYIHLIYSNKEQFHSIGMNVEIIKNKIYDVMISDFIEFHRHRMAQSEQFSSLRRQKAHFKQVLLHFKRESNLAFITRNESFLEHLILFQKKINELSKVISGVHQTFILENQSDFYALLCFSKDDIIEKDKIKETIDSFLSKSTISDTLVAIGPVFTDMEEVNEQMDVVRKMMSMGEKISPGNRIYAYNQLAINELLVKLSTEPFVQAYINEIVGELYCQSDRSLLETLIVYLQENGNASRAAERLFIHRRTMTNRLQRLKKLLSMDLDDSDNIFILQFCLKIKGLN